MQLVLTISMTTRQLYLVSRSWTTQHLISHNTGAIMETFSAITSFWAIVEIPEVQTIHISLAPKVLQLVAP